jgi:small-conductance mechanosensitive channel
MNNSSKKTLGEDIYSGSAKFGKISAIISAVFATLFCIIIIGAGVYVIKLTSTMKSVEGKVSGNSVCQSVKSSENNTTTDCSTSVTYTVDDVLYEKRYLDTHKISYNDNQSITIWYDPNNPNEPKGKPLSKVVGYLMIIISIIALISSWVWVYITRHSKFAAAAGGTSAAINLLRR